MPLRIFHLSDLHIGKRVHEFSMIEDQRFVLDEILSLAEQYKPHAVIIAGDVYDKPVPSAEAVSLLDGFLTALSERKIKTFIISGNHDSAERVSFGCRLMSESGIYISPVFDGKTEGIQLDGDGVTANVYLLPFIKPAVAAALFPDRNTESYTDAVRAAVDSMDIDTDNINILAAHLFVTGASRCESEEISVGGLDNVDGSVFADFDYVALGHIHTPQNIGDRIRYCGSPLKYSFSEAAHEKSVTMIEIRGKGETEVKLLPLKPLHDMREIKGSYDDLTLKANYENTDTEDFLHITLTDEDFVYDALGKLRTIYPNIMRLDYDNTRTKEIAAAEISQSAEISSPAEMLGELYRIQNNAEMSDVQKEYIGRLIEEVWEEK
ncbi:MAG: exonuclease SbcCD subunit D [Oscillospiraceae bacterium]